MTEHKPTPFDGEKPLMTLPQLTKEQLDRVFDWVFERDRRMTDEIDTDAGEAIEEHIRNAIVGRYAWFRRLHDEPEYRGRFQPDLSRHPDLYCAVEPWIVAAALALRPCSDWEWALVEAWSWVYRHAALFDVSIDDFKEWLPHQDPDSSRKHVKAQLMGSGRVLKALAVNTDTTNSRAIGRV